MNTNIENLKAEAAKLEEAGEFRSALEKYKELALAEPQNIEALFKLGEMHHQLGELPPAMSAYIRVIDLDPEHKKANVKIEMIKMILDYYNKDMINP